MTAFEYSRTKPEIWPESNCALATVADDNINSATAAESLIACLIKPQIGGNLVGEHIPTSFWLRHQRGCRGRARPQRLPEKIIDLITRWVLSAYSEFIFCCQENMVNWSVVRPLTQWRRQGREVIN